MTVHNLLESIIQSLFPVFTGLGLKNVVSLVVFAVVAIDLVVRKQVSNQAVTLIVIGIISLYLDTLVQTGEEITFFHIFKWKRKNTDSRTIGDATPPQTASRS